MCIYLFLIELDQHTHVRFLMVSIPNRFPRWPHTMTVPRSRFVITRHLMPLFRSWCDFLINTPRQGLAASEMHAYQGNLCVPEDPSPAEFASPEFSDFDVAAVGLGFHHFDDPALAARRLAERLKTGGVLVILDFLPHDGPDVSSIPESPLGMIDD